MPTSALRFPVAGSGRGSYSAAVTSGSHTAATSGTSRRAGTEAYVMAIGHMTPASTWASRMKRAARAAWAPGRPSTQGRPISPCQAARSSSECQLGWNSTASTRRPLRS